MRKLTKYFGTYSLAKYEKATGKGVMDLLDIGNFEVNKIANIIMLGNKDFKSEEEAYEALDNYLRAEDDNSLITAYFDLIDELDRDIKLMKSCGIRVADLKAEFKGMADKMGSKFKESMAELKDKNDNDGSVKPNGNIVELPVNKG